jgi:hypothetical protein
MPCNSEYLAANHLEIECSRMYLLLDELDGKGPPDPRSDKWQGYDRRAYNEIIDRNLADKLAAKLCSRVKKIGDLSKHSLELQVWARDHAVADAARMKQEAAEKKAEETRKKALKKLTPEERKALGL